MSKILPLVAVPVLLFSLLSCSRLGSGVVLWPPEGGSWSPGDVVNVKDESRLRSTYIVNVPGSRTKAELENWRIRLFQKEKEAVAWAVDYAEWSFLFAESTRQGLPLRSEPSSSASQVYKTRDGEVLKVLGREPGPVLVGEDLEGYWYRLLAEGGVEAYGFDYYLRVFRLENGERVYLNDRESSDPVLEKFLSGPWRPEYYAAMVADGMVELGTFRQEYGLFPDPDTKTMTLKTKDRELTETWTEVVPLGRNRYDFLGTSFRLTMQPAGFASLQYTVDGEEVSEAFVRLRTEVETIIEEEISRRDDALERLVVSGPTYGSRSYGSLTFFEDGRFSWTGKSSLISRGVIAPNAGNGGSISLDHFISPDIVGRYDGVIVLRFDSGTGATFLYTFEEGGLRLLYAPDREIRRQVVLTDQFIDPVRIFFVPQSGGEGALVLPDRD